MRILVFVGVFPRLSQTFILNQITGLIDAGHDVTILAKEGDSGQKLHADILKYNLLDKVIYYGGTAKNNKRSKGIEYFKGLVKLILRGKVRLFKGKTLITDLLHHPNLILLINKLGSVHLPDFDIIHAHFGPNGILAKKTMDCGYLKGKLFTTFHGYDMLRHVRVKGDRVYEELFRSNCTILPISHYWEKKCLELGAHSEKIRVHHMGIDVSSFDYSPTPYSKEIHIVSAARFVEKKGLEYGIKAISRLIKQGYSIRYSIAGGGPLEAELRQLIADRGLTDHIQLLGWKTQDELIELMKNAHLILVPSVTSHDGDMEGIPVQLMEAMAMGKIVISSWHSGIPELVRDGENGYLVRERDSSELAETIKKIIESPEDWERIARNARKTVINDFNINKLNEQLINMFQTPLNRKEIFEEKEKERKAR